MLPGFIIDQIRQREEEERAKREVAPQIQLPMPMPEGSQPPEHDDETERGVVIIDLLGA
jgi:hypothetical protein